MEILSGLSDNQSALVMCGAALLVCGTIMSWSHYLGGGRSEEPVAGAVPERPAGETDSHRKAA
jgi:hypothetical protein